MNQRQRKKARKTADTPRGSLRVQAFYQALADADDTLEAAARAIYEDDPSHAARLIESGRESIAEHIETLKGLL